MSAGGPGVAPVDDLLDARCGAERLPPFVESVVALPFSDLSPLLFGQVLSPQWDEGFDLWCGADRHVYEGHVRADSGKAQTKGRHWARLTKPTSAYVELVDATGSALETAGATAWNALRADTS